MVRLVLVACLAAGVLAAGARAEMPQNTAQPEIGGRAAVGALLLGHNGTWLYADGSGCGPECAFSFRWEICTGTGCETVATTRHYRPRRADLGRELRLAVTATKYDCGAWNGFAGTQECALDSRSAYAPFLRVASRDRVAASAAWPARPRIERAAVRGRTLHLTVADTFGRLVSGSKVSVRAGGRTLHARSRADGSVVLRVRPQGPWTVVARAGGRAVQVRLR